MLLTLLPVEVTLSVRTAEGYLSSKKDVRRVLRVDGRNVRQSEVRMTYPERVVEGHRSAVTELGVSSLETATEVDEALTDQTGIVVVNSVCGCASQTLIPALEDAVPDVDVDVFTVFAGVDDEATAQARTYFSGCDDSSPSIAFLDQGSLDAFLSRGDIFGADADELADSVRRRAEALRE